jgi:hypothetical protein
MSKLRAVQVQAAVTGVRRKGEKASIQPLITYLREGYPLTDALRDWIIHLLEKKGEYRLELVEQRSGPKITRDHVLRHIKVFERFQEIAGAKVSSRLSANIAEKLGGTSRAEVAKSQTTYFIARPKGGQSLRLVKGKVLSREATFRLVASEFRYSIAGVKKIIRNIEKAQG